MNDIQEKIAELQEKGWTIVALAEELDHARVTVDKWKSGERYPSSAKAILAMLDHIASKKRIPKQRRYVKGSRSMKTQWE